MARHSLKDPSAPYARLSKAQLSVILRGYLGGATVHEICSMTGLNRQSVSRNIRKFQRMLMIVSSPLFNRVLLKEDGPSDDATEHFRLASTAWTNTMSSLSKDDMESSLRSCLIKCPRVERRSSFAREYVEKIRLDSYIAKDSKLHTYGYYAHPTMGAEEKIDYFDRKLSCRLCLLKQYQAPIMHFFVQHTGLYASIMFFLSQQRRITTNNFWGHLYSATVFHFLNSTAAHKAALVVRHGTPMERYFVEDDEDAYALQTELHVDQFINGIFQLFASEFDPALRARLYPKA